MGQVKNQIISDMEEEVDFGCEIEWLERNIELQKKLKENSTVVGRITKLLRRFVKCK